MEPITLRYRKNESISLERDVERVILRSKIIELELPISHEQSAKIEWYARRGEELERRFKDKLKTLLANNLIRTDDNEQSSVFMDAYAALEISRAFEEFGHANIARTYESIHQNAIAYAYTLDPNRTTN